MDGCFLIVFSHFYGYFLLFLHFLSLCISCHDCLPTLTWFIFKMLVVCFILASAKQNFYKISNRLLPVWASFITKDFAVTRAFFL